MSRRSTPAKRARAARDVEEAKRVLTAHGVRFEQLSPHHIRCVDINIDLWPTTAKYSTRSVRRPGDPPTVHEAGTLHRALAHIVTRHRQERELHVVRTTSGGKVVDEAPPPWEVDPHA